MVTYYPASDPVQAWRGRCDDARTEQIASTLGVTSGGLRYLAELLATGRTTQRGRTFEPLVEAGLVFHTQDGTRRVTAAGISLVEEARKRGW